MKPFTGKDFVHHKWMKPAILEWLTTKCETPFKFEHTFADQFISVNVWCGEMNVSLDFRQPGHKALFNALPDKYKGTNQKHTGKRVNLDTLYFKLSEHFEINYPEVAVQPTIIHTQAHKGNDDDTFYVYTWLIKLTDGTEMNWENQEKEWFFSAENSFGTFILPTYTEERYLLENIVLKFDYKPLIKPHPAKRKKS
jgi:hypothetical protein